LDEKRAGKTPDPEDSADNSSQGIASAFGAGSFAETLPTIFEPSGASQVGPA
jgi:hypothetical protein